MDSILRTAVLYFVLLVLFRIAGRRTLSEMTTFDFVLMLIIGEATEQVLVGDDPSLVNAVSVISTLLLLNVAVSVLKVRSPTLEKVLDGVPTIVVQNGRLKREQMRTARVTEDDLMEAARRAHGIETLDRVKFAIVEVSGGITIIPDRD